MTAAISQRAFAEALLDPAAPPPAGLTTARGAPDGKRLDVYRNNVVASLGKTLESRFPVTVRLVGQEFFRGMACAFIAEHRPRSPLIAEYGDELPEFIGQFEGARGVPYLADVARLEAAWGFAYHAAEAVPVEAGALAGIAPERLADARIASHPSASLIRSAWPIGSIWAAHQQAEVQPVGHSRAETVLIVRPDAEVNVHILPAEDAGFIASLMSGDTFGEAAERAGPGFDFGRALIGLIGLGAVAAIAIAEGA